jgi:membrane-associated phospholipid phosphatase
MQAVEPRPFRLSTLVWASTSAAALVFFVVWTFVVRPWNDGTPAFDWAVARDMQRIAEEHEGLRLVFVFFTIVGSIPVMVCIGVCGVLGSLWLGHRRLALAWLAATLGGSGINLLVKDNVDRARPPTHMRDPFVHETNGSFPSGHAMGATIGLGMLTYASLRLMRRRWPRIALVIAMAVTALCVGLSRIFLRAHWFSDVIAGFAIGVFWLTLWITWLDLSWTSVPADR